MNGYKTCPDCGAEHKLIVKRCGCGHQWRYSEDKPYDQFAGKNVCEYEHMGQRCHYHGGHNHSTTGGGKFYCWEHFTSKTQQEGAEIVARSHREVPEPDYSVEAAKARYLSTRIGKGKPL